MKAMILAAGLGTRLRPLTNNRPKALVPIANIPIISQTIDYLKSYSMSQIIVNSHHHYAQIVKYLDKCKHFGLDISVTIETEILGTGGGIKNTQEFWDEKPFIVINSDILTNIDLNKALEHHNRNKAMATMVLHDYSPFNQIQIDKKQKVIDISQKQSPGRLAFTGIHIINPNLLEKIPESQYSDIISIYRKLISKGVLSAYVSNGHYWRDIGSIDSYIKGNYEMLGHSKKMLGPATQVADSVKLNDWYVIGKDCVLEEETEITGSILWDNVVVKKGVKILDSIVTESKIVEKDLINEIY